MSGASALAAVSRSLRNTLIGEMADPTVPVTLLGLSGTPAHGVNLFLHRVDEHPQLRNADHRLATGRVDVLSAPPLSLVLRYLMTASATPHDQLGDTPAQELLGEAMRVFHQHSLVPKEHLDDDLENGTELGVVLVPIEADETTRLWGTTGGQPYRLSVQYEVSVVRIDPTPEADVELARRVERIGVPQVRAPYDPPVLLGATPLSGPPGTVVRVTGEHLAGWSATVTVGGTEAASEVPLTADELTVTVPAGLAPGFHRLRVDVSRLARAGWFFEVRP